MLAPLAADDTDERLAAITALGELASPAAAAVLDALGSDRLFATEAGRILIQDAQSTVSDPETGETLALPEDAASISINNRLRVGIANALAAQQILSGDVPTRLAAVRSLQRDVDPDRAPLLRKALTQETDPQITGLLRLALANIELSDDDPAMRLRAAQALADATDAGVKTVLAARLVKQADGSYVEPDASVRAAVRIALHRLDIHLSRIEWLGNLFYGASLGSVLLLAALGLAITFGLMGIINMAHGELLMIGAYATYVVQYLFRQFAPMWTDWYLLAALPVAFAASALVGMALEHSVIRWLYGRPLETLLATWGISLILMQGVRSLFGAQNVEVGNPSWMSGSMVVLDGLVLPYNRLVIIGFSLAVVVLVWVLLNRTRLGLFVRAVTQNRRMASCVGVPTGRVDMLTFGLGSGIAGLGGVALSQLGNVGPDLGQAYIVDSFMVVVLGGVGQLAGTVIAAIGLGEINKFLEPYSGAVMAKITILVLIVLFIQKRPQGLFALKGRSVE
ncbi:urea ABC transporter permease subunit UrtB [Pigmentiphaga aceris]|uniref:Urea ABC transporter permease subunit UrtB n=2 Tax=Pigmentiphaga aceris TaxID=1940612 RepID=A0A5C0B3F0_9BURK|nr:urea ABC transporter permease subunit UrtB [Pigmentiphaga aceris]QEI09142.1 urea ABC transporter permease subunit UrtB [Pigmentiphaga aceris]